jgi:beta-glucosidase
MIHLCNQERSSAFSQTPTWTMMRVSSLALLSLISVGLAPSGSAAQFSQQAPQRVTGPWSDSTLPPDRRAALLLAQMTTDEKIALVHGSGMRSGGGSNGGAGYVPGIPRLGIPALQMADAVVGVTRGAAMGRYSTPFPSQVALSSSWDVKGACEVGATIGDELFDQGYTMSLGGGVNITREPRNGRNFEYKGEDPVLAGKLVASEMRCLQARGILGDIKHFAANDQETGRTIGNTILDERTLRETDLLPFEIALREMDISGVMCSYNKVNGDWACENSYLMNDFLKKSVGFKGFVLSDWGATHSTKKAALAGLDMEEPGSGYFGDSLKAAVERGDVPMARLDDMVKRILRSQFAVGQFDSQRPRRVPDPARGVAVAQRTAERGIVLLKNADRRLPLSASQVKSIAVIGSHADVGVLSGGGSSQVEPPGGNPVPPPPATAGRGGFGRVPVWHPSSPLNSIRSKVPHATVTFDPGTDPPAAAAAARRAEVAVVFVNQHASEGRDLPSLALPDGQDALVAAVAAANPRTIVVLEAGGAVMMPWIDRVSAVLAAWYPGIRGGEAIANLLFGDVNPSGKLVLSFPRSESDLPHQQVFGPVANEAATGSGLAATQAGAAGGRGGRGSVPPFDMAYTEGLKVGYKWYDAEGKAPLFAFGHGLSYTTYAYSGLHVDAGKASSAPTTVSFVVKNTGARAGREIAQVYASLPASAGEPPKRLVGWDVVELKPGESKTVRVSIDPMLLSVFDASTHAWRLTPGQYVIRVGGSSATLPLTSTFGMQP